MACKLLMASTLLFFMFGSAFGGVLFSTLPNTLIVGSTTKKGAALRAGDDTVEVNWAFNTTLAAETDSQYVKVKAKLCFAPHSQEDRAWRKTKDDLKTDKTCQFTIVERPYNKNKESFVWMIERDVPTATYFVRAYAYDGNGNEVGYGQSTNSQKTANLFDIQAISGRHASIDIAAGCFSAFSVITLCTFFFAEKRRSKK